MFTSGEYRGFTVETLKIYSLKGKTGFATIARRGNLSIESKSFGKNAREGCREYVIDEIDKMLDKQG